MDISPDKQNLDRVFSSTIYYIDFYQRDYRWTSEPVNRLLSDVFHKFRDNYAANKDLDPSKEVVSSRYSWYYLNTYVTNFVDGRVYIVDGQQRLTTISLVLIKLFHMSCDYNSGLKGWIEGKIAGQSGFNKEFWMNHVGHTKAQQQLYDRIDTKKIDVSSGITAVNIVSNYVSISDVLEKELSTQHAFETFVFFFLYRLVLINLSVEHTDVSMVFEVINDRGVRLRPYEILKGKLLGQIDKFELDKENYNGLWDERSAAINNFKDDELDNFFKFYFKSKYALTRKDGQRFDGDYHRSIFSQDMDLKLGLNHNSANVKSFLKGEFSYYTKLYVKILNAYNSDASDFRSVYYNALLDLDAPFFLTLSACNLGDTDEDLKIRTIAAEVDRYFSLLQLQSAYDSNEFADSLFLISSAIRGQPTSTYRSAFDKQLISMIAARRNVPDAVPLSYPAFRQAGINLNTRFKRYFFGRIDQFIAENTNQKPPQSIADLVTRTGSRNGFHVEHILAWNSENKSKFDNDEERFEQERNRLGGILLLKGRDNISSNNESYEHKLRTYSGTLLWNQTLLKDAYKSKLDMEDFRGKYKLDIRAHDTFGPDDIEIRHRLLFDMVKIIWA